MTKRRRGTLLTLATVCLLSGCTEQYYRSETEVNSDGSIERAIHQPLGDATPDGVQQSDAWEQSVRTDEIKPHEWSGPIRELTPLPSDPESDEDKEEKDASGPGYFGAWGRFPMAKRIPDHYVARRDAVPEASRLERHYQRHDYGLVIEHDWRETLTETIALENIPTARRQAVALLTSVLEDTLETDLGPEYDVSSLIHWLRTDGGDWLEESTNLVIEFTARYKGPKLDAQEQAFKRRFAQICARYGLEIADPQGAMIEEDATLNTILEEFAAARIREHVKRRDGKPLSPELVDKLVWFASFSTREDENGSHIEAPLQAVARKVVKRRFGSRDVFAEKLDAILAPMVGVYQMGVFTTPRRFHYSLTMPGRILETNGLLTEPRRVEWQFAASDAFPFGVEMQCRSIEAPESVQQTLFGRQPLSTPRTVLAYRNLLSEDEPLTKVMRECAASGSLDPLSAYGATVTERSDAAARLKALQELLQADDAPQR